MQRSQTIMRSTAVSAAVIGANGNWQQKTEKEFLPNTLPTNPILSSTTDLEYESKITLRDIR